MSFIPAALSINQSSEFATEILSLLVGTLIFGTLNHKFGNKITERYKKNRLKKKSFEKFKSIGFVEKETYLIGYINDFLITITPNTDNLNGTKWIDIAIYFNPKQGTNFISQSTFAKLKSKLKNTHILYVNSLHIKKNYVFRLPKYDTLYNLILEGTRTLKAQNIQSISYEEWQGVNAETIEYYKHFNGLSIG